VDGFRQNWFLYHVSWNCTITVKSPYIDPVPGRNQLIGPSRLHQGLSCTCNQSIIFEFLSCIPVLLKVFSWPCAIDFLDIRHVHAAMELTGSRYGWRMDWRLNVDGHTEYQNHHALAIILDFCLAWVAFTIYLLALLVEEGIRKSYRGAHQRYAYCASNLAIAMEPLGSSSVQCAHRSWLNIR
jgi:hypothetical protein